VKAVSHVAEQRICGIGLFLSKDPSGDQLRL